MSGHYRKEHNCLNCGHIVEKHYCSACGQPNLELKENFWGFMTHSVGHYFHFDAKFWKTLNPLLTKPGQVTLDYLAGKRARYIHPVSLYIFVSIVYFLIVPKALESKKDNVSDKELNTEIDKRLDGSNSPVVGFKEGLKDGAQDKSDDDLDTNDLTTVNRDKPQSISAINKSVVKSIATKTISSPNQFRKLNIQDQRAYVNNLKKENAAHPSDSLKKLIEKYDAILIYNTDSTYKAYQQHQQKLPAAQQDGFIKRSIKKEVYQWRREKAEKTTSSEQIDEEVKHYLPKQYFILMPLLAFFIMINFRKNRIYYIDHLVFTVHGMTAFFLVSIVAEPLKKYIFGLDSTFSDIIEYVVYAGIIWYLYTGLKLFYNRSRNVTIRKTISVMFLYSLALGISHWVLVEIITYMVT